MPPWPPPAPSAASSRWVSTSQVRCPVPAARGARPGVRPDGDWLVTASPVQLGSSLFCAAGSMAPGGTLARHQHRRRLPSPDRRPAAIRERQSTRGQPPDQQRGSSRPDAAAAGTCPTTFDSAADGSAVAAGDGQRGVSHRREPKIRGRDPWDASLIPGHAAPAGRSRTTAGRGNHPGAQKIVRGRYLSRLQSRRQPCPTAVA
jgi:hypothetical protein